MPPKPRRKMVFGPKDPTHEPLECSGFAILRIMSMALGRWIVGVLRTLRASSRSGLPVSIQQLLHRNRILDDSEKLKSPLDLQLVLLPVAALGQETQGFSGCSVSYRATQIPTYKDTSNVDILAAGALLARGSMSWLPKLRLIYTFSDAQAK